MLIPKKQLAKAKRIPRIKTLRRALGLTQDEFATRYHIPLGTLRDWEQGRAKPDQQRLPAARGAAPQRSLQVGLYQL